MGNVRDIGIHYVYSYVPIVQSGKTQIAVFVSFMYKIELP